MWKQIAIRYFGTILGAAAFVVIGVFFWRRILDTQASFAKKIGRIALPVVFVVLGLTIITVTVLGPSPAAQTKGAQFITEVETKDVLMIELLPYSLCPSRSLVKQVVTITEEDPIDQVCKSMQTAVPFMPNHPHVLWWVLMRVHTREECRTCIISMTGNTGLLIEVLEGSAETLPLAELRCDSLAGVLEKFEDK